ncbi:uncharacterized protein LOC109728117 [Ananas comosus]|uniref:Uncharacterized protein LOC109726780 n=1 Tax=Ananas comosus TaxID=4615 RepID=A0A199URA2_ANACO|nr:uncharacterized protein LOC109726780 [Ananas comosus]XP_020114028.1 uncharacterized protein LOC109728117 [Ananas comosus]OAY67279.1 hypothetical protein ACMD2_09273 [Ananas comosus]
MVKICIEICIISARGLRRKSSLLKPQWFAVGWIDPNNKYCTKIDTSGSPNPTWKTKFSVLIDGGDPKLKELSLTVEVHRREPIFLREHLQGVAVVPLKEFIAKFVRDDEGSRSLVEETGSFQLRKRSSGKPKGLVDVSISISEEREGPQEGFTYSDHKTGITLAIEDGPVYTYPTQPHPPALGQHGGFSQRNYPYTNPLNRPSPSSASDASLYGRPPTPPPPPPPSYTGFLPAPFPPTARLPESYINMPSSRPAGQSSGPTGPGFTMGLGAGALAAGAMIFGDDFLSGPSFPADLGGGSLTVSTDPPF